MKWLELLTPENFLKENDMNPKKWDPLGDKYAGYWIIGIFLFFMLVLPWLIASGVWR